MIISRTPYRISFFGGGTDYPAWYGEHGGAVLATTINKYCYLHCRFLPPFFEHRTRVVWSMIETVKHHHEITHPAVRAAIDHLGIEDGLEIHHIGDLPARAGLGSSSAFAVGLLNALHGLQGRITSQTNLAHEAIYVEQELVGDSVGIQDQIVTAVGGLNRVDIARDGSFIVTPLLLSNQRIMELHSHLMLFFTGVSRNASTIAADQIQQIPHRQNELSRILQLVDEAQSVLSGNSDITEFGRLLDESWKLKQSLSSRIAPAFVNDIYTQAMSAGAMGGKLLGAGGGGFFLVFAPPETQGAIRRKLSTLLEVSISFERSGTRIIFYEPPEPLSTGYEPTAFDQ